MIRHAFVGVGREPAHEEKAGPIAIRAFCLKPVLRPEIVPVIAFVEQGKKAIFAAPNRFPIIRLCPVEQRKGECPLAFVVVYPALPARFSVVHTVAGLRKEPDALPRLWGCSQVIPDKQALHPVVAQPGVSGKRLHPLQNALLCMPFCTDDQNVQHTHDPHQFFQPHVLSRSVA